MIHAYHTNFRSRGYSLLELVITIVVIGILSVAAMQLNFGAIAQHSVTTQADELRRNLSHIQLMAISGSQRLRLTVSPTGTNYTVESCTNSACTATSAVTDPATGQNFSVGLTDDVTFAAANRNTNLDFDSLGRPLIAATRTYTLSGSGRNVSVTVLPITGFARTFF